MPKIKDKTQTIQEMYEDILSRKRKGYVTDYNSTSNIYHTLTYFKKCVQDPDKWVKIVNSFEYGDKDIQAMWREKKRDFERIRRIISIGNYWIWEEWILILLMRINLEMVKDFFHYRNLPFPDDMDLKGLCEEMKELSQTKKNKRVFESSVRTMQKNSPLPFVDIWFEADRREEYLRGK